MSASMSSRRSIGCTSKPEEVDALVVHRWVMKKDTRELSTDDEEGIQQIKALRCHLTGENGVRQVQNLFIRLRKIRMKYRLKTSPKQIIYWVTENLTPARVKTTVTNLQRQEGQKGRKASKNLDYFHKVLRKIAKKFKTSYDLGLEGKSSKGGGRSGDGNRRGKNRRGGQPKDNEEDSDKDKDTDRGGGSSKSRRNRDKGGRAHGRKNEGRRNSDPKPVPKHIKCINCNGNHYVSDCPRLSKEKRKWTFEQHLAAKRARSNGSDGAQRSSQEDSETSGRKPPGVGILVTPRNRFQSQSQSPREKMKLTPPG